MTAFVPRPPASHETIRVWENVYLFFAETSESAGDLGAEFAKELEDRDGTTRIDGDVADVVALGVRKVMDINMGRFENEQELPVLEGDPLELTYIELEFRSVVDAKRFCDTSESVWHRIVDSFPLEDS